MPDKETEGGSSHWEITGAISLGERLSSARRARAISLEQAARSLHLDKATVAALEAEDFSALGAPVFVKGHLRSYAELLGLSPDEVIEAYREVDPAIDELPVTVVKREPDKPVNVTQWSFLALVGIATLLVGVYVFNDEPDDATGVSSTEPSIPADPTPAQADPIAAVPDLPDPIAAEPSATNDRDEIEDSAVQAPAADVPAPAEIDEPAVADAPDQTVDVPDVTPPSPVVAEPPPEQTAIRPARLGSAQLTVVFGQDSWAEISDAAGRILYGLQREGTRRELAGDPPIAVFLGNAAGVEILVDGAEYQIPAGARRGNTARFEIDLDEEQ